MTRLFSFIFSKLSFSVQSPKVFRKSQWRGSSSGQTLIETVVAIFILAMGITAAANLATYGLSNSTSIVNQIVAIGLAREGIEAVQNIRDTNWLQETTIDSNCYDYTNGASDAKCYKGWLSELTHPPLVIYGHPNGYQGATLDPSPSASANYLFIDGFVDNNTSPPSNFPWGFFQTGAAVGALCPTNPNFDSYKLDYATTTTSIVLPGSLVIMGFYSPDCTLGGNSNYYRKVTLQLNKSGFPYNQSDSGTDDMAELEVTSDVWWTGKGCTNNTDYVAGMNCSVQLQTYLTNWKDY